MGEEFKNIDVKIEGFFTSHDISCSAVQKCCFFPKLRRIVSIDLATKPSCVMIWDIDTKKCLKRLSVFEDEYCENTFILKWNDNSFLCSFTNGVVRCFSVTTFKMLKEVYRFRVGVDGERGDFIFLKKISDDLFFCTNWGRTGQILIISYSREEIVKRFNHPVSSYSILVQSEKFPNAQYFNCYSSVTSDIRLINFKTNKVIKTFNKHSSYQIRTMAIIKNLQLEEILVAGVAAMHEMYFYNTSPSKEGQLISKVNVGHEVSSILRISARFFAVSYDNGSIQVWDSNTRFSSKKYDIHKKGISSMCKIDLKGYSGGIVLVTTSLDQTLALVSISGILLDSFELKDLLERVEYLRDYSDDEDVRKMVISLSLSNITKWNIFRSLLV